jgi:predicted MPP superfamily phosphohydrolase
MSPQEQISVLLFLFAVAAVYIFAFGAIVRIIFRKKGFGNSAPKPFLLWIEKIAVVLAIVGIFCMAYGYFIEPYRLTVRNVEIKSSKVNKPLRIAHISDIHSDPEPRLEEELPKRIAELKPDIIVYSGDSLNSPEGLPVFRKALTEISKIAPTYVVRGNWDVNFWSNIDLFGQTGANELDASVQKIDVKGNEIWLAGIPFRKKDKIDEILKSVPKDKFSIFIDHYPDEIEMVAKHKTDLYVAGHTHGGQIALPLYGALITFSKYGKRFEGGTYKVDNTYLNVNRGIGMEGGNAPRVRFWAPPEITVIDVIPGGDAIKN